MPRAGEGPFIRIDPEVDEAPLTLKRGNMTFSDVIAQILQDRYGRPDGFPSDPEDLEDFVEIHPDNSTTNRILSGNPSGSGVGL